MSDDTDDDNPMVKARNKMVKNFTQLAEMFPDMRPMLEEKMAEVNERVADIFRPMMDLADGKITVEEYQVITRERAEADRLARIEHYGPGPVFTLTCDNCGVEHEWEIGEYGQQYPPLYFVCEDITGESCEVEEEDEWGEVDKGDDEPASR